MNFSKVVAQFGADISGFMVGLQQMSSQSRTFAGVVQSTINTASKAWGGLTTAHTAFTRTVSATIGRIAPLFSPIQAAIGRVTSTTQAAGAFLGRAFTPFQTAIGTVTSTAQKAGGVLARVFAPFQPTINNVTTATQRAGSAIGTHFSNMGKYASSFASTVSSVASRVSSSLTGIGRGTTSFVSSVGSTAARVSGGFVGMGRSILGAVSGVGQWLFFAKQGIQIAGGLATSFFAQNAAMEQTTVAFKGLLGSGQAASAMMKQLQAFAAATPFEFPELAKDTQELLGMGVTAKQIIPWMTAIGDAAAGVGAGQEGVNQITLALGQMQAKAKISGDEMMQLTEAGIPAWKILANSMGLTVGQVQDLSQQGKLGQDAIDKLVAGIEKMYSGQMKNQATTFNGLLSTLKDNAGAALRAFAGPLFETAKGGLTTITGLMGSPQVLAFATTLGQGVGGALRSIVSIVAPVVTWFQQLIKQLQSGAPPLNSFAYDLQVLQTIFDLLGQQIAAVFAPAWAILSKQFQGIIAPLSSVTITMRPFGEILQQVAGTIATFDPGPLSQVIAQLTNTAFTVAALYIENIRQNFLALQTILVTAVIPAFVRMWPTIQGVLAALAPLGPVLLSLVGSAFQLSGVIRDAVVVAFQVFMPLIADVVTNLGDFLIPLIRLMMPAFQAAAIEVRKFIGDLSVRLIPAIRGLGVVIGIFLQVVIVLWKALWPSLIPVLQGVWDIITGVVKIAWSIVSGLIKVGLDVLAGNWGQAWTDIKDMFAGIWDGITSILRGTWGVLAGIFLGILAFLGRLWQRIWGDVSKAWNGMWGEINDWVGKIWNTIRNKAGDIFNAMLKPFRDAGAAIGGVVRGFMNAIIDRLDDGLRAIENFVNFFGGAINNISKALGGGNVVGAFHIALIPHLARGTNFFAGGPAVLGEEGRELAFLPRGTVVAPHRATEDILRSGILPIPNHKAGGGGMASIPGFAGGVGDWLGTIFDWLSGGVKNIGARIFDQIGANLTLGGSLGNIAGLLLGKVKTMLGTWVNNLLPAMGGANLPQFSYGEFILPHINTYPGTMMAYGFRHRGYDFAFGQGSPLHEVIGGMVEYAKWMPWGGDIGVKLINGLTERYLHLSAMFVHAGELIKRGALIGLTGGGTPQSGLGFWSSGSHLHYQIDRGSYGADVNPLSVLKAFHLFHPFVFDRGGIIPEPVAGFGLRSGAAYSFGGGGPETVTPGVGGGNAAMLAALERIERALTNNGQVISEHQIVQALGRILASGVH